MAAPSRGARACCCRSSPMPRDRGLFLFGRSWRCSSPTPEELEAQRQELARSGGSAPAEPVRLRRAPGGHPGACRRRAPISRTMDRRAQAPERRRVARQPVAVFARRLARTDRDRRERTRSRGPRRRRSRAAAHSPQPEEQVARALPPADQRRAAPADSRARRPARLGRRCATCSATCRTRRSTTRRAAQTDPGTDDPVRHQGRGVRAVDPALRGAGAPQLVRPEAAWASAAAW